MAARPELAAGEVSAPAPFTLGWEEWCALPRLGLPAVRAKVDTGAKTSALHAFDIEPFGPIDRPKVRFVVHPIPDDEEVEVVCSAMVVDRREVVSSNGEAEMRYVIETPVKVGGREWPIEITLTNRDKMTARMLLGRSAIPADAMVSPSLRFVQGRGTYDAYGAAAKRDETQRALRIAILTREPDNYSTQRLLEAARARGHEAECIDTLRCYMAITALALEIHYDGEPLPHFDAVIPRIGASVTSYGLAVLRQFEAMGVYVLNVAEGVAASRDKLYAHQLLARHGIDMPATAVASSPKDTQDLVDLVGGAPVVVKLLRSSQGRGVVLAETKKAAESLVDAFRDLRAEFLVQDFIKEAGGADVRCFVVGGKVIAAMRRVAAPGEFRSNLHRGGRAEPVKVDKAERSIAVRAVKAMGLTVAGVDLLRSSTGPKVLEVNSSPGLEGIERASGKDVAGLIVEHVERSVRSVVRRARAAA